MMSREYITLHIYRAAEQIYSKNKTVKVKLYCDINNIDFRLWGQELSHHYTVEEQLLPERFRH